MASWSKRASTTSCWPDAVPITPSAPGPRPPESNVHRGSAHRAAALDPDSGRYLTWQHRRPYLHQIQAGIALTRDGSGTTMPEAALRSALTVPVPVDSAALVEPRVPSACCGSAKNSVTSLSSAWQHSSL
jgi:hypothetical protein